MVDFETQMTPNGTVIVKLYGRIDKPSCRYVFEHVNDILNDGNRHVVIDCDNLDEVNASVFEMLLRGRHLAHRRGCQILLAAVHYEFTRLLAWLHFDRIFNIYPTARLAVNALECRLVARLHQGVAR